MAYLLVIDDQETFLDFLARTLKIMGYRVKTARGGKEAIEILKAGDDFDLVITDIFMSDKDGIAVAKHIRSSRKADTPIVGITGDSDMANHTLFNAILIKPFKVQALNAVIQSLLKNPSQI